MAVKWLKKVGQVKPAIDYDMGVRKGLSHFLNAKLGGVPDSDTKFMASLFKAKPMSQSQRVWANLMCQKYVWRLCESSMFGEAQDPAYVFPSKMFLLRGATQSLFQTGKYWVSLGDDESTNFGLLPFSSGKTYLVKSMTGENHFEVMPTKVMPTSSFIHYKYKPDQVALIIENLYTLMREPMQFFAQAKVCPICGQPGSRCSLHTMGFMKALETIVKGN